MAPTNPTPSSTGRAAATASLTASRVNLTPSSSNAKDSDGDVEIPDAPTQEFKVEANESIRVALPDKYHGSRKELETFLLQVEIYFNFNDEKFTNNYNSRSLWVASYLRGSALEWVQPFMEDFFENEDEDGKMATTKKIFKSWEGMKKEMRRMFGDIDAVKVAVRKLLDLRQTGSAITYATDFQKYGTKTGWDSLALMELFQRGLKPNLREEMARQNMVFHDTVSMIETVVQLDNRLYEFRKGNSHREQRNRDHRPESGRKWEEPRKINAAQRGEKKPISKEEHLRRRKDGACFECGLTGHRAAKCPRKRTRQVNATSHRTPRQLAATSRVELTEENLEEMEISTQLEPIVSNWETWSTPSEIKEEETPTECQLESRLPDEGDTYRFIRTIEEGNLWRSIEGGDFIAPHQTTGAKPSSKGEYVVQYTDMERVVFKEKENEYFQQSFIGPKTDTFRKNTPYRLEEWTRHYRVWVDQFRENEVTEILRNPRELCATKAGGQLLLNATLRGKKLRIMVDSGADGNYISPATIARINIPITRISPYELQVVDGSHINHNRGVIDQGTVPSKLVMEDGHTEEVQFDIAPIGNHQAILGMPWIRKHNPEIDWIKGTMSFSRCRCVGSQ